MGEKNIKKNDEFGLENVKSIESDVAEKSKENSDDNTESSGANQHIKTDDTEIIKKDNGEKREVLIGDDIEEIEKIEEGFNTGKRKLLNKLLK